jgi:hypothetical protein
MPDAVAIALLGAPFVDLRHDVTTHPNLAAARAVGSTAWGLTGEIANACAADDQGACRVVVIDAGATGDPAISPIWQGAVSTYGVRPSALLTSCVGEAHPRVRYQLHPPNRPAKLLGDHETASFLAELATGEPTLMLLSAMYQPASARAVSVRPGEVLEAASQLATVMAARARQSPGFRAVVLVRSTVVDERPPQTMALTFGFSAEQHGSVASIVRAAVGPPRMPDPARPICCYAGDEFRQHVAATPLAKAGRLWVGDACVAFSQVDLNVLLGGAAGWGARRTADIALRALSDRPVSSDAILAAQDWQLEMGGATTDAGAATALLPPAYRVDHTSLEKSVAQAREHRLALDRRLAQARAASEKLNADVEQRRLAGDAARDVIGAAALRQRVDQSELDNKMAQYTDIKTLNSKLQADFRRARRAIEQAEGRDAAPVEQPDDESQPKTVSWRSMVPSFGAMSWMSRLTSLHRRAPPVEPVAADPPVAPPAAPPAAPLVAPPVVVAPPAAPPIVVAPPIVAPPIVAPPAAPPIVVAPPIVAPPVVAQPPVAPPVVAAPPPVVQRPTPPAPAAPVARPTPPAPAAPARPPRTILALPVRPPQPVHPRQQASARQPRGNRRWG